MTIHVFEQSEIHPDGLGLLAEHGWQISTDDQPSPADEVEAVLVRSYTPVDKLLLDRFAHLKFVLRVGVGLDTIDQVECQARGIQIFYSPGSNATAVAEHALWLMLSLLRGVDHHRQRLADGGWRDVSRPGQQLSSQRVGLVGFGAVGKALAQLLQGFGVKCQTYDPYVTAAACAERQVALVDWDTLWQTSSLVSIQIPSTPQTIHSIGATEMAALPKGSWLVNVGRGEVLDEVAVMRAVESGQLAGVGLDVFTGEPKLNPGWLRLAQSQAVILTPHIAALTTEAHRAMTLMPIEQLLKVTAGGVV